MISEADIMGVVEHHCLAYTPKVLRRGHVRVDTKPETSVM
jgi:hypothetical protein